MSRFMKFYPSDWRAEPSLKLVSRAARSLWLDMLGLMHDAGSHRLEIGGKPMTERDLADILGDNPRTIKTLLSELENAGVFDRDEESFVFSRRLNKERIKHERDTNNGRMGGNPALLSTTKEVQGVNPRVKAIPDTRYQKEERGETYVSPPKKPPPDRFDEFWDLAPRKVAKPAAQKAYAKALRSATSSQIIAGMRAYAETRIGQDPQYTAHPATWLNAGRWNDEPEPIPQQGHRNGKPDRANFDTAHREYTRRLAAGEINLRPDPSDPFAKPN